MRSRWSLWVKGLFVAALAAVMIQCAPTLRTFVINGGAAVTNSRLVTLDYVASIMLSVDQPTQFLASESPAFTGAAWAPLSASASPQFTLSAGNGEKTVYLKVRNAGREESGALNDTIQLIETNARKWARAIDVDGFSSDEGYSIAPLRDGGYVAAGLTMPSSGEGASQGVLVKIDADGAPQVFATFGDPTHNEIVNVVKQTLDGGVIAAGGMYNEESGDTHAFARKFTANLTQEWFESFTLQTKADEEEPVAARKPLTSFASDVLVLASGGYILAGTADYNEADATGGDMFLLRLNGSGRAIDLGRYGTAETTEFGYAVAQTTDGGLVAAGQRLGGSGPAAFLVKVRASLTNRTVDLSVLWSQTHYGDAATGVLPTKDGGVVYCGFTETAPGSASDSFLARVTADGQRDESFGEMFGGTGVDRVVSLAQDAGEGFVLAGVTSSYGKGAQAYLVKADAQGKPVFQRDYGNADTDDAKSVAVAADGGYILAGFTETAGGARNGDIFVVKTDSLGLTSPSVTP